MDPFFWVGHRSLSSQLLELPETVDGLCVVLKGLSLPISGVPCELYCWGESHSLYSLALFGTNSLLSSIY